MTDERSGIPSTPISDIGIGGGDVRSDVPLAEVPTGATEGSTSGEGDGESGTPLGAIIDAGASGSVAREQSAGAEGGDSGSVKHSGQHSPSGPDLSSGFRPEPTRLTERVDDDAVRENTGRIGAMFADLAREFGTIVAGQIAHGRVEHYPSTSQWISLAPGWVAKMIYSGGVRDVYIKVVHNFSPLPTHSHPQRQHVYVVSGSLSMTCGEDDHYILEEGDALIIPPDVEHSMVGNVKGDTLCLIVYEPPMMH